MTRGLPKKMHWAAAGVLIAALCCTQSALAAERVVFTEGFTSVT